jgi:CRISPR-associated protein Cmr6
VGPYSRSLGLDLAEQKTSLVLSGATPEREPGRDANSLVLLRRTQFCHESPDDDGARQAKSTLMTWAQTRDLGQDKGLVAAAARRREAAIQRLTRSGASATPPMEHRRLVMSPQWRLITGAGDRTNPYEVGIAMHGTYGWPVLPGSTLKGVALAWATARRDAGDPDYPEDEIRRAFGTPGARSGAGARGTVRLLDALPLRKHVKIKVDVVTPHVQPYYAEAGADDPKVPPASWHNPVPAPFLVVEAGSFAVDLVGPRSDVRLVAKALAAGCDELGVGAKTGVGYGYLLVEDVTRKAMEVST